MDSGYCFFHLLEIYKFENLFWALILSSAGMYLATCGEEDKMVFYLDTLLGVSMKSLFVGWICSCFCSFTTKLSCFQGH